MDQDQDADQAEIDAAWSAELGTRLDQVARDDVELVDADVTYRMLSAELADKHT